MCRTMKELENAVADYRSLKALKEQLEEELKAVERKRERYQCWCTCTLQHWAVLQRCWFRLRSWYLHLAGFKWWCRRRIWWYPTLSERRGNPYSEETHLGCTRQNASEHLIIWLCYRHDGQGGHTEVKDNKKLRRITLILLIVKLVCDVIALISYQRKDDSTKH